MTDAPSTDDLERLREGVRYCQIGRYEVDDIVYGVEVWNHEDADAPALFGIEVTDEERARDEFDDIPICDTLFDVFLFRASVAAVGDDVPDDLTVDNWPNTEEPVLLSDVEVLDRRPPSAPTEMNDESTGLVKRLNGRRIEADAHRAAIRRGYSDEGSTGDDS